MQEQDRKLDFTGQHIYVGLDVSKRKWLTSVYTERYEHKTFSQEPKVTTLVNYLRRNFPCAHYHIVYEAGYCGFWIHEAFTREGIDCIVVNPADVPTRDKEHAHKTDPVDARKLARSLRNGDINAIYVPLRASQEDRSLVRLRHQFVQKQTRCKNQLKALLSYYGISIPDEVSTTHWSRKFITWLEQVTFQRASGNITVTMLLEELKSLRGMIANVTKQIRLLSTQEPYTASIELLRTIDGISVLSGMIFLTEIVDVHRFQNTDQLASYCGIVPGEHSSGDRAIVTGMVHRGNPVLRSLLIECAWVAVRKDPALIAAFERLTKQKAKNNAIIRIARKLLNRIYFVLKHQQAYQPGMVG
jgi:transposase